MALRTAGRPVRELSEADALAWALRFAQADLTGWRDGDWLNALDDAMDFVTLGADPQPPSFVRVQLLDALHRRSVDRAKALLEGLQPGLKDFFTRLDARRALLRAQGKPAVGYVEVPFVGKTIFVLRPPLRRLEVFNFPTGQNDEDRFRTEMLLRAGDLLTRIDLSRLKRCPECGRVFLAVRRQRFDTPQCSLRDRKRRFRQKTRARQRRRKSPR